MKANAARALLVFCIVTFGRTVAPWAAVHLEGPANSDLNIGFLVQPQLNVTTEQPHTPDRGVELKPYLRRTRIYAFGHVAPKVAFFFQTDIPNLGFLGDWTPRTQMQDAFVEFQLHSAFVLDAGLVYTPFSHPGMQAAHNLLGVDYPVFAVDPPSTVATQNGVFVNNFNGRDLGVMARGLFVNNRLEYRLALTQGVAKHLGGTSLNPDSVPRITGRLTFNFFEVEGTPNLDGYFYAGSYLEEHDGVLISPKRVLSLGASASYQPKAVFNAKGFAADYQGYNVDLFVDLPMHDGTQALNGQLNFYYYDQDGPNGPSIGGFSEAGYRFGRFEPLVGWEFVRYENLGWSNFWRAGVNYWFAGHTANVKLDAGAATTMLGSDQAIFVGRLETQVAF